MPINVKHQSFADCETLTIFGAKRGKGNFTDLVRVQFSDLDDLKEFQNELNNLFPENVTIDEKFKEPKEEGYYLSQTGILLLKDEWGWSVIRVQRLNYTILGMGPNPLTFNQREMAKCHRKIN